MQRYEGWAVEALALVSIAATIYGLSLYSTALAWIVGGVMGFGVAWLWDRDRTRRGQR